MDFQLHKDLESRKYAALSAIKPNSVQNIEIRRMPRLFNQVAAFSPSLEDEVCLSNKLASLEKPSSKGSDAFQCLSRDEYKSHLGKRIPAPAGA